MAALIRIPEATPGTINRLRRADYPPLGTGELAASRRPPPENRGLIGGILTIGPPGNRTQMSQ